MKTIKSILTLLVLTLAFSTTSCDNEPIDPAIDLSAGGGSSSVFTAKIDGSNFVADETIGDYTETALQMDYPDCPPVKRRWRCIYNTPPTNDLNAKQT